MKKLSVGWRVFIVKSGDTLALKMMKISAKLRNGLLKESECSITLEPTLLILNDFDIGIGSRTVVDEHGVKFFTQLRLSTLELDIRANLSDAMTLEQTEALSDEFTRLLNDYVPSAES